MFFRLGLLAFRFRWLIVTVWTLVAIAGLAFGPALPSLLTAGGWDDPHSDSSRALATLRDELGWPRGVVTLVFEDEPDRLTSPEIRQAFADAATKLKALEGVSRIAPADGQPAAPYLSDDGRAFRINVEMTADPDQITDRVPRFREIAGAVGTRHASVTGTAAVYYDFQIQSEQDLRSAEIVTFPLALVALIVFFGSLAAAVLPLLVAAGAVAVTTALVYLLALHTTLSVYVLNTATMLGLAVAIDYCLLVVTRFREELRTLPVSYAVARTSATAGRAVLFSGLTVLAGVSGLLFFSFPGITSIGVGGAIVVAFAILASVTLLPAVLGILGRHVEFGRVLRIRTRGGMWHAIATNVMRRPFIFIVSVTVIVVALAYPATHIQLGFPSADALPADVDSRVGLQIIQDHFGTHEGDDILIAAHGDDLRSLPGLSKIDALTRSLAADPRVARVVSATNILPGATLEQLALLYAKEPTAAALQVIHSSQLVAIARERWIGDNTAAIDVSPTNAGLTNPTRDLVREIRAGDATVDRDDLQLLVGGITAAEFDFVSTVYGRFPLVIAGVVTATLVILFLSLNSVVLPLKAVIMNGASVLAAYGVLTLVFQDGVLARQLGVVPRDHLEATLPILIFCVLFGVSMDYEVFLLTRMREFWDRLRDNTGAVAGGLERTGRVVTSAALVFVVVVGSFARADIVTIKALGVALATAILLDATIIRALLVPATMRVLGRWNWWSPLRRGVTSAAPSISTLHELK
ncbi:MAG: MMPL family transporter [Chloroflexi bacterium]|nr:MAG: MMPL family transporter [Chloroflexota bacterium]